MDLKDDPYIKIINLATEIGTGWGLSPKHVSKMLGREMASDADKIEWSIGLVENPSKEVEDRAFKVVELKVALDQTLNVEAQRDFIKKPHDGLEGKTLYDLITSGNVEDLDNAHGFIMYLYGG